ncbi:hypothetical protein Pan153_17790 [Gimesia panareensis]|uniref:Uncharacterized protein n=1 Tax=Gimesia panareensis TaxID=2527978 RepID=A0A518FLA5_9PLAN|nr:hypothetical protein [Gimesia panareensis]QDV17144.1 hypothetical protein Pan153_17790 [Gimesia panareensis]
MAEELLAFKRACYVTYILLCLEYDVPYACPADMSVQDRLYDAVIPEETFREQQDIFLKELLDCESEVDLLIAKAESHQKEKEICTVGDFFQMIADDFSEEFAQTLCLTSLLTQDADVEILEEYLSYYFYVRYFITLFLERVSELSQADTSILSITSLNWINIQNIADTIPDYVRKIGKAYGVSTEYVAAIEAKCERQKEQINQLWERYNKLAKALKVQ